MDRQMGQASGYLNISRAEFGLVMSGLTWFNRLLIVFFLPLLGFHRDPAGNPTSAKSILITLC